MENNPNTPAFSHCPGCGGPGLKPDSLKSFSCPDCGFLFFINCASAAMALIIDKHHRLLVTRRKYDPGKGGLDLPGGFSDPGEGIEQGLAREIKEELNLTAVQLTYFASHANDYPYKGVIYPVTDMAFTCEIKDFSLMKPGDDVADILFIPVWELEPTLFVMDSAQKVVAEFKASRLRSKT